MNQTTLLNLALQIFQAFVPILLNVNLSLNEALLTFLLSARQTWMTQFILGVSLCETLSFSNSFTLCERRTFFYMGLISKKLSRFLFMFLSSFTSLSVSLLFPLLITFFVIIHPQVDSISSRGSLNQPFCCVSLWRLYIRHKNWLFWWN